MSLKHSFLVFHLSGSSSLLIKHVSTFPSSNVPRSPFNFSFSSSLPPSVCEVRGWTEVTEGRCFHSSFEDVCEDGGRNSGKWFF